MLGIFDIAELQTNRELVYNFNQIFSWYFNLFDILFDLELQKDPEKLLRLRMEYINFMLRISKSKML